MIKGSGTLISTEDEEGELIPFFTTDQILEELQRFGFYVEYDVKSNLPMSTLSFLATVDNLGYDKITRVALESVNTDGDRIWTPIILIMKSQFNDDLLTFDCKLTKKKFQEKLAANTIMNVTHEQDLTWDWVKYIANISDILDENIDPTDDFITDTNIESGSDPFYRPPLGTFPPEGSTPENDNFTLYSDEVDSDETDSEG